MPLPPLYQTPGTNFHDVNLDWIINQVKLCIAEWSATKTAWTETQEAWTELQEYVQNYFANLDVDQEISDKIDAMAEDGSLLMVIHDTVALVTSTATEDWLADHVSPETGYVLDNTLTIPSAAASAAAAGIAIKNITNYSVTDYNVVTGRIYQNKWYATENGRTVVFPVDANKTYTITAHNGNRFNAYGFNAYPVGSATAEGTALNAFDPQISAAYDDLSWSFENSAAYSYIAIEVAYSTADPFPYTSVYVSVTDRIAGSPLTVNGIRVVTPDDIPVNHFRGKTFSILGDSISSIRGDISEGNTYYYTGNNHHGVTSIDQMWYRIMANKLGMTLLQNQSTSGARVCKPTTSSQTAVPVSLPERCQALDLDGTNPDIVIIAAGLNDFTYRSSIEEWDQESNIQDNQTFEQSYIAMLSRIHYSYPNAKIFCIGPWYSERLTLRTVTNEDETVIPCVRTDNYTPHTTRETYAAIIRKVCSMCGATFIDGNVGFNEQNFYNASTPEDGYCQDAEPHTHPNWRGQQLIGNVIADRLLLSW